MRNHFDLHIRALGQAGHLHRGTRRKILREIFSVHFIHGSEVCKISHKDRALDDVVESKALIVEDGFDILQCALGLRFDVTGNQIAVLWIHGNLPGAK